MIRKQLQKLADLDANEERRWIFGEQRGPLQLCWGISWLDWTLAAGVLVDPYAEPGKSGGSWHNEPWSIYAEIGPFGFELGRVFR